MGPAGRCPLGDEGNDTLSSESSKLEVDSDLALGPGSVSQASLAEDDHRAVVDERREIVDLREQEVAIQGVKRDRLAEPSATSSESCEDLDHS